MRTPKVCAALSARARPVVDMTGPSSRLCDRPGGQYRAQTRCRWPVEIPSWRHAVIRFSSAARERTGDSRHARPERDRRRAGADAVAAANAHAVLFVLAADTGDPVRPRGMARIRECWPRQPPRLPGRAEQDRRSGTACATRRGSTRRSRARLKACREPSTSRQSQVFPVSAQKALVAESDTTPPCSPAANWSVSRPRSSRICCRPNRIWCARARWRSRRPGPPDPRAAQRATRRDPRAAPGTHRSAGKNQSVIEYMMRKVKSEKEEFEQGPEVITRCAASSNMTQPARPSGPRQLRDETRRTREAMLTCRSRKACATRC